MTTTDDVLAAVTELRDTLDAISLELSDVPEAVENRNETALRDALADGEDDRTAIDKWFRHRRDEDTRESTVEAVALPEGSATAGESSPEYVLVRSEMHSQRKAHHGPDDDDDGSYHAVWVVGRDGDGQAYFIHRAEWRSAFETPLADAGWTVDDIRGWLGFDATLPPTDEPLEPDTWYPLQGDVIVKRVPADLEERLTEAAHSEAAREQRQKREAAKRAAIEDAIEEARFAAHEDVSIYTRESRVTVRVDARKTPKLKAIQSDLGIEESEIRDRMNDEWQQLTAKRRKKLLCRHIRRAVTDEVDVDDGVPDLEPLQTEARAALDERVASNRHQQHFLVGNHLVIVEDAIQPYPGDEPRDAAASMLVPEATTIITIHDEHGYDSREIAPGIISIDVMERHDRA
jgi:chemotaxis protein histidine kinase CheA